MPSLLRKCLKIKIISFVFVPLACYTAFQTLLYYSDYNYNYIATEDIDSVLYKKTLPDVWQDGRPNCSYEHILTSKEVVDARDVLNGLNEFEAHGITHGSYSPSDCNPLFSVAIIVTFRNRQEQLDIFLPYIHNFLRKQNIHYKIYLVEQDDKKPWNKGLLYNLGARAAMMARFPCLVLHDVDLLPLARANLLACCRAPRHLSASVDKFRYILPYESLVGGVLAIQSHQFNDINGFSNQFLEWGGEDDDLTNRIYNHNLTIIRFHRSASRYAMRLHPPHERNAARMALMAAKRAAGAAAADRDGLRSPSHRSLRYEDHTLYTLLKVKT